MNVLVFSEASWDDKNSFGNTVSNFFSGKVWEEDRFCNFYARKQMPDNTLLVDYYNLSAFDIVKGILRLRIRGKDLQHRMLRTKMKHYSLPMIKSRRILISYIRKKTNLFIMGMNRFGGANYG